MLQTQTNTQVVQYTKEAVGSGNLMAAVFQAGNFSDSSGVGNHRPGYKKCMLNIIKRTLSLKKEKST